LARLACSLTEPLHDCEQVLFITEARVRFEESLSPILSAKEYCRRYFWLLLVAVIYYKCSLLSLFFVPHSMSSSWCFFVRILKLVKRSCHWSGGGSHSLFHSANGIKRRKIYR